ncbi:MAG TPA: hypothetical protein VGO93_11270 [Candidatus Xenobia bacterium]|jgi:hypothetical protein
MRSLRTIAISCALWVTVGVTGQVGASPIPGNLVKNGCFSGARGPCRFGQYTYPCWCGETVHTLRGSNPTSTSFAADECTHGSSSSSLFVSQALTLVPGVPARVDFYTCTPARASTIKATCGLLTSALDAVDIGFCEHPGFADAQATENSVCGSAEFFLHSTHSGAAGTISCFCGDINDFSFSFTPTAAFADRLFIRETTSAQVSGANGQAHAFVDPNIVVTEAASAPEIDTHCVTLPLALVLTMLALASDRRLQNPA